MRMKVIIADGPMKAHTANEYKELLEGVILEMFLHLKSKHGKLSGRNREVCCIFRDVITTNEVNTDDKSKSYFSISKFLYIAICWKRFKNQTRILENQFFVRILSTVKKR